MAKEEFKEVWAVQLQPCPTLKINETDKGRQMLTYRTANDPRTSCNQINNVLGSWTAGKTNLYYNPHPFFLTIAAGLKYDPSFTTAYH